MFVSRALNIGQQSGYAQEICKHEANYTQYGPPGRPYVYYPFPAAMYKVRRPKGTESPMEYCQLKVNGHEVGNICWEYAEATTETELDKFERLGFVAGGRAAAVEHLVKLELMVAEAAAERAFVDSKMSDRARAEADAKDSRTIQHLGEIPADPLPPKRTRVDTK